MSKIRAVDFDRKLVGSIKTTYSLQARSECSLGREIKGDGQRAADQRNETE